MPEPLTFRTRYDTVAFFLLALGALLAAVCLLIIGPVSAFSSSWPNDVPILLVAYALVAAAACAWRWRCIVLSDNGLERRWLWFRRAIPWADVTDVRLPIYGLFGPPAIVLWLHHQRLWRLCLALYRPMRISSAYRDYERLVHEVLARAPHAKVSDAAQRHLAAPHLVALRHRLPAALLTALSLAMLAWVFAWMLWGERLLFDRMLGAYVTALVTAFAAVLAAGPLDREWCWKSKLMLLYPLVIAFLAPFFLACGIYFGVWGQFLVACAACAALGVGNLAVCLPLRRGWLVFAACGVCLAAGVAPALWRACREPIPFRKAMAWPDPRQRKLLWSPDGRTLCAFDYATVAGQFREVCHLIDAASLERKSFPLIPTAYSYSPSPRPVPAYLPGPGSTSHFFPDDRHVLVAESLGNWPDRRTALWVLDTTSGRTTEVFSIDGDTFFEWQGSTSPDRSQVAFVAESKNERALYVLRLPDLKVERVELDFGLKEVYGARFRSDGALMFQKSRAAETDPYTLWLKMPDDPKPKPLYRLARPEVRFHISPDGRWAVVGSSDALGTNRETWKWKWEIVDLLTGRGREHGAPGEVRNGWVVWAPGSRAFAYVANKGGKAYIVVVDPATGHAKSCPTVGQDLMRNLDSLSCDGRYAAFWTDSVVAPFHIMDLDTGRTVRLLRAPHYLGWEGVPPSWSPVGHRLAMECTDALFPRPTCCLHLFDVAPP